MQMPHLTVGDDTCDLRGFANLQIQCAIEHVAALGGGTVELSAGTFVLTDAVHLRSGVTVRGQGGATLLRKAPMRATTVASYLGFGQRDIVVAEPERLHLGDGYILSDERSGGFYDSTGTLVAREGQLWFGNRPHAHDYTVANHGRLRTLFPLISAVDVQDVCVEGLTLEGHAAENELLNGCRGAALFAHRTARLTARDLRVHDFNGDGIGFQTCDDVTVTGCTVEGCTGNGLHPGSGSQRFHMRDCAVRGCGGCGIFYCLRVRDSLLEDCLFENNRSHGVGIWARDTGNVNRRLTIRGNSGCGICFIPLPEAEASHDMLFEACDLQANAVGDGPAEVIVQGQVHGVRLLGNSIARRPGVPAILVAPGTPPFESRDNRISPDGPDAVVFQ